MGKAEEFEYKGHMYYRDEFEFGGDIYLAFPDLHLGESGEAFYCTAIKEGDKPDKNGNVPKYILTFEATLYNGCDGWGGEDDYDCGLDVVEVEQID